MLWIERNGYWWTTGTDGGFSVFIEPLAWIIAFDVYKLQVMALDSKIQFQINSISWSFASAKLKAGTPYFGSRPSGQKLTCQSLIDGSMHRNQQGSHKEMPRWDRQRLNRSPELSPWGVARKTRANSGANKMRTESQIPTIVAIWKCGSSRGYHSSLTGMKKFRYTGEMFKQLLINFIDLFLLLFRDQSQRPSWILG